jgi:hypothetical protein
MEAFDQTRRNVLIHAYVCLFFQLLVIVMLFGELTRNSSYYCLLLQRGSISLIFVRFVCITILHLTQIEEVSKYLSWMKFTVNHHYRIQKFNQAFLISFMGFFVCILIEISNIVVLLCTADTLNLVSNFVSLVIIA